MFLELPWDQPTSSCSEYVSWKAGSKWTTMTPWSKLDTLLLSLLRKMLSSNPTNRLTLQKVRDHKWILMQFSSTGMTLRTIKLYFLHYL